MSENKIISTVGELIDALKEYPKEMEVILDSDLGWGIIIEEGSQGNLNDPPPRKYKKFIQLTSLDDGASEEN